MLQLAILLVGLMSFPPAIGHPGEVRDAAPAHSGVNGWPMVHSNDVASSGTAVETRDEPDSSGFANLAQCDQDIANYEVSDSANA